MWKQPNRPSREISETYNDGVVKIYSVSDEASPGSMPKEEKTIMYTLCYREMRMGITRYYTAYQNHQQVERVIRIPKVDKITNQCRAVDEHDIEYQISLTQTVDDVYPPSLDITLSKVTAT